VAASTPAAGEEIPRLVQFEKMAEHVGSDPETQQQVVNLCLQALAAKLPQLRHAISTDDLATIQRIAHYLRGSLGLLGLPALVKLGEDIEYHHEDLGAESWRQRCEQFVELLDRVNRELHQLRAA
jgi:HPt (histidine-containing phosphotransfer) domain-containing protein